MRQTPSIPRPATAGDGVRSAREISSLRGEWLGTWTPSHAPRSACSRAEWAPDGSAVLHVWPVRNDAATRMALWQG